MNSNDKLNDFTHQAVKDRLPFCSSTEASKFGNFYYKEWKSADETEKKKIEEKYLQDIVHSAVYLKPAMAEKLRRILQSFVNQKRIKMVDSLLFRLLKPVVWRGLNAVNGHVRANAVALFLLSFPMRDSENGNSKDNYESLQKQTEILETFLNDQIPSIRSSSVIGICKIFDLYWELIAINILKNIFCIMVDKLAFDSVSADVRAAVIKGFIIVLDNPLSHNVLEKILPQISMILHDNSEKVRIIFLNLLHKIKGTKTIKYWNISSMDHILARLTVETSITVQKLITKLIQNSFCPANLEPEERLQRGVVLIEKNYEAARKFFHFVGETMPSIEFAVEYIILMLRCVYSCVKQSQSEQNGSDSSPNKDTTIAENEHSNIENDGRLTLENRAVVCGLLECGAVLWRSIGHQLQLPENLEHHKRLVKISSKIVQECFAFFEDSRINDVLLFYASLLPASSSPYLASSAVKKLKNVEDLDSINPKVFGSLLEAACFWRFKELTDMIIIWLDLCGDLDRTCSSVGSRSSYPKRSRQVKFAAKSNTSPPEAKPRLGLAYLEYFLTHTQCRQYLLRSQGTQLSRLCVKLDKFFNVCFDTIKSDLPCCNNVGSAEILLADRLQFSIQMLLTKGKESAIDDTVAFFVRKLVYHEFQTLDLLSEENERIKSNAEKLLLQFFTNCQHLLMLNLASDGFVESLCIFLLKIAKEYHVQSLRVFCGVASVAYNVVDFIYNCNHTTINIETLLKPLIDVWCQIFLKLTEERNEFLIENENFWKPAYVAIKESLTMIENITKDEEMKIFCTTNIEKLSEGVKSIREVFFCFFSTTVF